MAVELEKTLVLLKPDAIRLGLKASIDQDMENVGLSLIQERHIELTRDFILKWRNWDHYTESFWRHVAFVVSAPVIVQIWQGLDAISKASLVKRKYREKFAESEEKNVMHSSSDADDARDEICLFFGGL